MSVVDSSPLKIYFFPFCIFAVQVGGFSLPGSFPGHLLATWTVYLTNQLPKWWLTIRKTLYIFSQELELNG